MLQTVAPQPRTPLVLPSVSVVKAIPSVESKAEAIKSKTSLLTSREREILGLVAEGFSNKLVGHELFISERTVKNHLTNIMVKLQALDRTHAVVTALRRGWLSL